MKKKKDTINYLPRDVILKLKIITDLKITTYKKLINFLNKKYRIRIIFRKKEKKSFNYVVYIANILVLYNKKAYLTKNKALYFAIYDIINLIIFNGVFEYQYFIFKPELNIKKYFTLFKFNTYFIVRIPRKGYVRLYKKNLYIFNNRKEAILKYKRLSYLKSEKLFNNLIKRIKL